MKEDYSAISLYRKLRRTLMKKRAALFASGLLAFLASVFAVILILVTIAATTVLPVAVKLPLIIVAAALLTVSFIWYAGRKLLSGDIESVALSLEEKYPLLEGRLIAAIQFARMKSTPGYSSELMDITTAQAADKSGGVEFSRAITQTSLAKYARFLAVTAIPLALLWILAPGHLGYSFEVYTNPTEVVAPPLGYKLVATPGSVQWVKYRDIDIGASVFGDRLPGQATIHHRLVGGSWQETEIDFAKSDIHRLDWGDSVAFSTTMRQVNKSFDYYVEAGRVRTEIQHIDVVDRPRVTGIELALFYPGYTGLSPNIIRENNGSFSAVVGSRVNVKISTNLPVESAELVFADSSRQPMQVDNLTATTPIRVDRSHSYFISLRDHLGENNPDPIEYYITAVPDEYPSIDVIRPGFDVNLNDDMMLPLKVRIFDDYGFSSLVLKYTVISQGRPSEENVAVLHYSERIKTEGEIEFNWELDQLNLFPGDYVTYYFEVADNDDVSGPKVTASRQYVARLPSLDEIIAQTEAESAERISNVEQLMRTGQDLSQRLKNAARKLQAQNNQLEQADWQQQKELEAVIDKNAEMVEQIERLAETMEKSLEQLNDKALLSRDILEKLAEVQKLFEEIATPEMKEAQKRLMEALESMDPQQLQDALNDFQMSQEELLQRLERTLALLKKLQLEQVLESMIRKVEEMARQQEAINKKTEDSPGAKLPEFSGDEQKLKESLDRLQQESAALDDLARMAEMDQSAELQKFREAVENTTAGENMQNMTDALGQQKQSEAMEQGAQAYSELMEMLDQMQQQMMAMSGSSSEAMEREMRTALQDANNLSQMQEQLLEEARGLADRSMMLRDLAAGQQDLSGAVSGLEQRIRELGKQSPFIAAELQNLISNATRNMELAMKGFDEKKGREAVASQRQAMTDLNRASIRLMESLNQQRNSQSGGSCNKNTSMLQGLADQQNQLNQQTQQMMGQGQQGQGRPNRDGLRRLAAEQGTIRKSMEDLAREFAGSRQILGRLDDIAREMKDVEESLESGEPGGDLTEQQLKIYSRMLEASRSLYRKDFSEQRQAKTATGQVFFVPPELSREILDDRVNLEDRLRRYLGGNYPPQYEEQIKAYFRALLQIETQMLRQNSDGDNPEATGK